MRTQLYAVAGFALALSAFALVDPIADDPYADTDRRSDISIATIPNGNFKPIPDFIERGMDWLAQAQFENGGWGAGTHAHQEIRDPKAVRVDPATTAFSAMALMRSGSTLTSGPYRINIARALDYVLTLVENAPEGNPTLSSVTGTQPQVKLGQNIDISMVTQFLSEILIYTKHDRELHDRVALALDSCLHRLEISQDHDGSWNSQGGWAGVLQSAMANNALEMAQTVGRDVDESVLDRSRQYQKGNVDAASGAVRTEAAAGVSLYSVASNQRATAQEAKKAQQAVESAVLSGELEQPTVSEENLSKLGYSYEDARRLNEAFQTNRAAENMLESETVLSGFGNNGGEEFLSYMMTSESLVVSGSEKWDDWHAKMKERLAKIQNADGSWSGHHCITSPVFCTAAVIMTVTADRGGFAAQQEG